MSELCQILYASSLEDLSFKDLQEFKEGFKKRNGNRGVSGILMISSNKALQVIEGHREVVSKLFLKISSDKRHSDIQILGFYNLEKREFPLCDMTGVFFSTEYENIILGITGQKDFQPHSYSSAMAKFLALKIFDLSTGNIRQLSTVE